MKYQPRNDYVVVKLIDLEKTKVGLIIPQRSKENKELRVIAVGPKVEDLCVGDSILISEDQDTFPLPNETNMFAVREKCVAVVVKSEEE